MVSNSDPTFNFEVHATKHQRTDELGLHLPLKVDKDRGQVSVRVVGDAGGGDGLQELGLRELPSQCAQVLVDEGTQRDAEMGDEQKTELFLLLLTTLTKTTCFYINSFFPFLFAAQTHCLIAQKIKML